MAKKKEQPIVTPAPAAGDDGVPGIDTSATVVRDRALPALPALAGDMNAADYAGLVRLVQKQKVEEEIASRERLDLATWRKKQQEGEPHTLPSGLGVYLKRVSIMDLAEQGGVPQTLSGMVELYVTKGDQAAIDILEKWPEYMEMVDLVVLACMTIPPIVAEEEEKGADTLWVGELMEEDKLEIFAWANGPARPLIPFRQEPK